MRPIFANQPEIERLSQPLAQSMRMNNAAIQTGWNQQHHGDGSHGAITAESAAVTGLTVLGKLRLRYVIWNDDGVVGNHNNITVAGLSAVSWLRIFPGQSLGADLDITGIDAAGRATGDLLLVSNCSSGAANDIVFHAENANSLAANRFSAGVTPFRLLDSRGVWLVYDYDGSGAGGLTPEPRWRIVDQA